VHRQGRVLTGDISNEGQVALATMPPQSHRKPRAGCTQVWVTFWLSEEELLCIVMSDMRCNTEPTSKTHQGACALLYEDSDRDTHTRAGRMGEWLGR